MFVNILIKMLLLLLNLILFIYILF